MKFLTLVVCFGAFAMAGANAASRYSVTLSYPSIIGDTELKPGDYKLEVDGDKAKFQDRKHTVEAAVKVETGNDKFPKTTVRYTIADGKYHVELIRVGGTNTTLLFKN